MGISRLVLGMFCFYTLSAEHTNAQKNAESTYLNMLEITSTATEITLQNLQQLMQQTLSRKEFTNALIVPGTDDYDRTLSVISQLRRIADTYAFVNKAFLYIPEDNMVYSSDLSYLPIGDSPDPIFRDTALLTDFSGARLSVASDAPVLHRLDNRLILCQHLYPDYLDTIGVLLFDINLSLLNSPLSPRRTLCTNSAHVVPLTADKIAAAPCGPQRFCLRRPGLFCGPCKSVLFFEEKNGIMNNICCTNRTAVDLCGKHSDHTLVSSPGIIPGPPCGTGYLEAEQHDNAAYSGSTGNRLEGGGPEVWAVSP